MRNLAPPSSPWELLVVDNNSTDSTPAVVRKYAGALPIRYLQEKQQGLSHARNTAVSHAVGEYLVWTDDDVLVDQEWLCAYERGFREFPDAVVFGGLIQPWFDGEPPMWLRENLASLESAFAVRNLGSQVMPLASDGGRMPYGANYAIRTDIQRIHAYDPALGRSGKGGKLGEETHVMQSILDQGYAGWWLPTAKVRHWIPKDRQSVAYIRQYFATAAITRAQQNGETNFGPRLFGMPRWILRDYLEHSARYAWFRLIGDDHRWVDSLLKQSRALGLLRYC